jgi:hypothetical protein
MDRLWITGYDAEVKIVQPLDGDRVSADWALPHIRIDISAAPWSGQV